MLARLIDFCPRLRAEIIQCFARIPVAVLSAHMCFVVMDYVAAVVGYCGITRRVAPREENGKFVVFGLLCPPVPLLL